MLSLPRLRIFIIGTSIIFCLFMLQNASANNATSATATDRAERQQMLAYSLLKNYALIGLGARTAKAQQELQAEIALFDTQLQQFKNDADTQPAREKLLSIELLWSGIKPVFQQAPSLAAMGGLNKDSTMLATACGEFAAMLAASSKDDPKALVSLVGKQRTLAQQLAALYALKAWGIDNGYQQQTQTAFDAFEGNLQQLNTAPANSTEIIAALVELAKDFKRFNAVLTLTENSYAPALADRGSSKIRSKADQLAAMYQQLPRSGS